MHPFGGAFDLQGHHDRLKTIEEELAKPEAWQNPDQLTPILREKSRLNEEISSWETLRDLHEELEEWLDMAEEDPSSEVLQTLAETNAALAAQLNTVEMELLLAKPEDKGNAILEIHPGAGGTEAQDWAEMLLRMYLRWCERREFTVRELDFLPGEEAGLKSVTLQIQGTFAYGLLQAEKGIHRLIRISPFDTSGRRHTSFASVDVYPEAAEDIEIEVNDEDIRVDVFRSSGPGGQNVNKTSSAIRITHFPSGIVVQCQNEKSQRRNKETAMKILKSRLYDQERKKRDADKQAEYEAKEAIAWGSQIRTYTLQPYQLVKDHRTNTEVGDVEKVLEGEIDGFLRSYLLYLHSGHTA